MSDRRDIILLQLRTERWQMACRIAENYPYAAHDIEPLTRQAEEPAIRTALTKAMEVFPFNPIWGASFLLTMLS